MNKIQQRIPPPTSHLPIIQHFISAYKTWHEFLPHVPKDSRYTLGIKIDRILVEILESLFMASYAKREQKLPHLEKATIRLDSEQFNEIGKMLGGWTRQINKAKENPA